MVTSERHRIVTILAVAALAAVGLAGCGRAHRSTPASAPRDAWQLTLAQVRPDGTVSLATALSAFVLAIGPVPGASAVAGPKPASIPSGTLAVNWVFAHWSGLTAAQRSAVLADLGATANTAKPVADVGFARTTSLAKVTPPLGPNVDCPGGSSPDAAAYVDDVAGIITLLAGKLGVTMHLKVYVEVNTKTLKADAGMYTYGCANTSTSVGSLNNCVIHVNPATTGFPGARIHLYFLHEMMHCFQFNQVGGAEYGLPGWFDEGSAEWAASVLGVPDAPMLASWRTYLATAELPTFERTYDGLGFFAHMEESGIDVWHTLMPMATAIVAADDSSAAGWAAAGISTAFLDSWGAGFVQGHYPGTAWLAKSPSLPVEAPELGHETLLDGSAATVSSVDDATASDSVSIGAEVVQVSGGPRGLLSLGGGADTTLAAAAGTPFCTGATCSCPLNTPRAGTVFRHLAAGTEYVGVTGGLSGARVTLSGMSLTDFCQQPDAPCLVGTWLTTSLHQTSSDGTGDGGAGIRFIFTTSTLVTEFDGMSPIHIEGQGLSADERFAGVGHATVSYPTSLIATRGRITLVTDGGDVTVQFAYGGGGASNPVAAAGNAFVGSGSWTCSPTVATVHIDGPRGDTTVHMTRVAA